MEDLNIQAQNTLLKEQNARLLDKVESFCNVLTILIKKVESFEEEMKKMKAFIMYQDPDDDDDHQDDKEFRNDDHQNNLQD